MSADTDRMFRPSARFTIMNGDGVSRPQAERTLISVLYNGDSHPDLVTFTCELAVAMRRGLTFAEAAEIVAADGGAFSSDGWLVAAGPGDDEREG